MRLTIKYKINIKTIMKINKSKNENIKNKKETPKSFKHLFKVIAKDLKNSTKGHPPKSLSDRVTDDTQPKR